MLNGRFAEACKTFFMATMFAALIQGVSAQSYSMEGKSYGSGGGGTAQSGAGTQASPGTMSAQTQLSGAIASISGATLSELDRSKGRRRAGPSLLRDLD